MNWNWSCDDLLWIRIRHRVITPKEEQSQVVLSEWSTFYHVMEKLSVHITGKRGGIISHLCRQNRGRGEKQGNWQDWNPPELGTRQFFRDNVTMFSGHKVVSNCHFTIFVVATPSRH